MLGGLYNSDILSLAGSLENGCLANPQGTSRKVSKLCGSWFEIDCNMKEGRVSECAIRIQACALGQASAAILKKNIIGASYDEIKAAYIELKAMLKEGGPVPTGRFKELALLEGVKAYPARHASTLLAFEAAEEAARSIISQEKQAPLS